MASFHSHLIRSRLALATTVVATLVAFIPSATGNARAATTLNVPADHATIQEAVDAALPGDTVLVAPGTYGGATITTDDISVVSVAGASETAIDGETVEFRDVTGGLLQGFTVQGARTGVVITGRSSGVVVADNVIQDNKNGGILAGGSDLVVRDNTLLRNKKACRGMGIQAYPEAGATILVEGNYVAESLGGDCRYTSGGGIAADGKGHVVLRNNEITSNVMTSGGSAIDINTTGDVLVEGNHVHGNTATNGSGHAIVISRSGGTLTVRRNVVSDNVGGGIHVFLDDAETVDIVNNIVVRNSSTTAGSGISVILHREGGLARIINNTTAGNTGIASIATAGFDDTTKVFNNIVAPAAGTIGVYCGREPNFVDGESPNIQFNNVIAPSSERYGGVDCTADRTGTKSNVSVDPLFASPNLDDYRLTLGSPMIDAGRLQGSPSDDHDGNSRPVDGDGSGEAAVDIGAFEFAVPPTYAAGVLTSSFDGRGIEGACVDVFVSGSDLVATTATTATGSWLVAVPPGTYRLRFTDCAGKAHERSWFGGGTSFATGADVVIPEGGRGGFDAVLTLDIRCFGKAPTMLGTIGNDTLIGTSGDDVIVGLLGDDAIEGGGGVDRICGGPGNDTLDGGPGRDRLRGDEGGDTLIGGPGNDRLIGSNGADVADYSSASRSVVVDLDAGVALRDGKDTLAMIEHVLGSDFDDELVGDAGHNRLTGRGGDDVIVGLAGDDQLGGGVGDDLLSGGLGDDQLRGGAGTNTVTYELATGSVTVKIRRRSAKGAEGTDTLADIDNVVGSPFDDVLQGSDLPNAFHGGLGDDRIDGYGGSDYLDGGPGDDLLRAGGGDDILLGGDGVDDLSGGAGIDLLLGGRGDDLIQGGGGVDAVSFELSGAAVVVDLRAKTAIGEGVDTLASIEDVVGSPFDDVITGNSTHNLLIGLDGDDQIFAISGDDVLDGMDGSDALDGGTGTDACYNGETHTSCEEISAFFAMGNLPASIAVSLATFVRARWLLGTRLEAPAIPPGLR